MSTTTPTDPVSGMVSETLRAAVASVEAAVLASTPALVCVIDASASIAMFNPALAPTFWTRLQGAGVAIFFELLALWILGNIAPRNTSKEG